jgi:hypothetical protein
VRHRDVDMLILFLSVKLLSTFSCEGSFFYGEYFNYVNVPIWIVSFISGWPDPCLALKQDACFTQIAERGLLKADCRKQTVGFFKQRDYLPDGAREGIAAEGLAAGRIAK